MNRYFGLFLLLFFILTGCSNIDATFREMNEEERFIWDTQIQCFEEYCPLGDPHMLPPPLMYYTRDPFCGGNAAGCVFLDKGVGRAVVYIHEDYAYRNEGQYPDTVPGILNTELFMHEYLHIISGFCTGDGSHENGWFNDSPCPQDLWREWE